MSGQLCEPLTMHGLLDGGWRACAFEPFREGVEICRLLEGEPAVALLRYAPGASVPDHRHVGVETICVLEGSQSDERGRYAAGCWVMNPPGFVHSVWSEDGCVVLVQWTKPVEFVDARS